MSGLESITSYWLVPAPLGVVGLAASPRGLVAVALGEEENVRSALRRHVPGAREALNQELAAAVVQVEGYFAGTLRKFELPCDLAVASPFSQRVLGTLSQIDYANTVSYGELACLAGYPGAARAVGGVMARNPLPLILPCHRVVGKHGALTGYSGGAGLVTKAWLLDFEARQGG